MKNTTNYSINFHLIAKLLCAAHILAVALAFHETTKDVADGNRSKTGLGGAAQACALTALSAVVLPAAEATVTLARYQRPYVTGWMERKTDSLVSSYATSSAGT